MKGSILTYEVLPETAKVYKLKERLQQQVAAIYIDIASFKENLNDAEKAKNYAKKVEEVLATPYFANKSAMNITIATLKEKLKVEVLFNKMRKAFLSDLIEYKRKEKLEIAQKLLGKKDGIRLDLAIRKEHSKYMLYIALGMTTIKKNEKFLKSFEWLFSNYKEINNQWKVLSLIGFIQKKYAEEDIDKMDKESKDSLVHLMNEIESKNEFFRLKKYREMTVCDFKKLISREITCNTMMYDYMKSYYEQLAKTVKENRHNGNMAGEENEDKLKKNFMRKDQVALELFSICDKELHMLNGSLENASKEYNLFRFFQGLLVEDIFRSLYV